MPIPIMFGIAMAAQSPPSKLKMAESLRSGKHRLEVRFEGRKVDPKLDRVRSKAGNWTLNGRIVLGTEVGRLENVLTKLEARIDGTLIKVPSPLVRDVANVHFEENTVELFLSADAKRFLIKMLCSDGAGGYIVSWHYKSGSFSRQVVIP